MPSFVHDEENAPVLAQHQFQHQHTHSQPLSSTSTTPTSSQSVPSSSSPAAYATAKSLATAHVTPRPGHASHAGHAGHSGHTGHTDHNTLLASVDSNVVDGVDSVNGTPQHPLRAAPPPPSPSFPPPSPPGLTADDADRSSTASSDMIVRGDSRTGGRSSSTGGAASSHATTAFPDDDEVQVDGLYEKDFYHNKDSTRLPSSSSAPVVPDRAPPLPPPPPTHAFPSTSQSESHLPLASHWPEAPSSPPPPPPPPASSSADAPSRKTNGPVSVPSPLVDRTRVIVPAAPPPPLRSSQDTTADASLGDAPRHSVASTTRLSSQTTRTNATLQLPPPSPSSAAPHRFSSPPLYNPGTGSSTGTSSNAPPSVAPPLKHRHTLEVPKPAAAAAARNSREGLETGGSSSVFASGRFSPTAVGGASSGSIGGGSSIGGRRASLSLMRRNTRSLHSELPRDEYLPDEDALRWAEVMRQRKLATKRRRTDLDDEKVTVGRPVDETHENWVAAYNMLTGIRVSVSRTNAKLDRPLTDEDFDTKQKSTFDIAGNEMVPSAKYDFKFKDYAPWVFRRLRALFHLDPADYLMSLVGKYILSEMGSPGKSGSFFYFSRDYKYIIKTIHHSEHKFLRKILKDYYQHVMENPNTLLSQFFGLHRVKMPYGRKIHFVVMNNLFPPHRDIHQTFDLKGSTIGRDYPEELLAQNPRATLKDLNWLRRHQHLELGVLKKRLFLEQLHRDVALLQRLQIMDYSLLVGTHDVRRGNHDNLRGQTLQVFEPGGEKRPEGEPDDTSSVLMRTPSKLEHMRKTRELRQMLKAERPIPIGESSNKMPDELEDSKESIFYKDDGGFQSTHENNTPADAIYYLGVIDCLTHYGVVKKIEHFWKGLSADRSQISALPPQQYGDRFLKFVSGITMSPEEAAQERAAAAAAAAAGVAGTGATTTTTTPVTMDGATTAAMATGREATNRKGKMAEYGSGGGGAAGASNQQHWPSHLRHRAPRVDDGEGVGVADDKGAGLAVGGTDDRRESMQQPALPMVDEASEASGSGEGGEGGEEATAGTGYGREHGGATLKPKSADSGYGVSGGRSRSGTVGSGHKLKLKVSRESLDKALPPLPGGVGGPVM